VSFTRSSLVSQANEEEKNTKKWYPMFMEALKFRASRSSPGNQARYIERALIYLRRLPLSATIFALYYYERGDLKYILTSLMPNIFIGTI